MSSVVLDASALLAFVLGEAGSERVRDVLGDAAISAVNLSEVIAKLSDYGRPVEEVVQQIDRLQLDVLAFTREDARAAASLRGMTRSTGLSLGDRSCLALAKRISLPALTADRGWAELSIGVQVELLR